MPNTRTSRMATSRAATLRPVARERHGQLEFDTADVPPGMTYQWLAESVLGAPNQAGLNLNFRNGWRPVPAQRHAQYQMPDIFGDKPDPWIRAGGQLLCERATELVDAELSLIRGEHKDMIRSLDYETSAQMDPDMPYSEPSRKSVYESPRKSGKFAEDE